MITLITLSLCDQIQHSIWITVFLQNTVQLRPDAEVFFWSHLQNSSTDVSGAGLTFHPKLGVVICFAVWHSIPATEKKPNSFNLSDTYFAWSSGAPGSQRRENVWNMKVIWGLMHTYLLMYSPVRTMLQVWHLKQLTCHCFSRARRDWPCLISSPHPAQSKEDNTWKQMNGIKERKEKQGIPLKHIFKELLLYLL